MTVSPIERRIRASLAIPRFLQTFMPHSLSSWVLKRSMRRVRLEAGVSREELTAEGVRCEWIIPSNRLEDQVLLYLHGGGFVMGLTPPHLQMVAYLAKKLGRRVLMVDYRLAPENPYPAALDDCVSAYHWLLKQGLPAQNIILAGDSAGGNLAITSLMKLRDNGEPLPAAAACLSPVTDLSNKDTSEKGFRDPLLPTRAVRYYNESYIGHNDTRNPLISPVYGNWHGLPPLLIHAGEDEILREDAVRAASLAKAAGVEVHLEIFPRMWHVWQLYLSLPQAAQSLEEIAQFLEAHMSPVTQPIAPG